MPNYAFTNKENIVREVLWFDESQEDLTHFIEVQKQLLDEDELTAIEVKDGHKSYSTGNVWNGEEFRPAQPYPSWLWDPNKYLWRPPVIHPNIWRELDGANDDTYVWNEENQSWDLK
jgi:hypothetical protein